MRKKFMSSLQTNVSLWPARFGRRVSAWTVLLLTASLLPHVHAQVPLPFYEPFPNTYTIGEELGQTGSAALWTVGNGVSSSCARVQSYAALEYPGLTNIDAIAQSYGLVSYYKDSSSTKDRGVYLAMPANGTPIYASCLVNFQHITNASTAAFFGFTSYANSTSVNHYGAVIYINPAGYLQIAKNSTTPATNATYTLSVSNTYLLVLRYKYNPGAPDQVDLWVNPTSLGNNASIPAPTITTTNNSNLAANFFGEVAYYQAALPTLFFIDEIRVATNWSGVTPTNPAPGNLYSVTGGGSGCSGDSFLVGLSGSDSGVSYILYTNGVSTLQTNSGTGAALSFGPQNTTALYTVLAINNTTSYGGWMSGSATVSVLSAPNIATQPNSVVVATNALCAFNVVSSGSGLNFQWCRNGTPLSDNGHIVGSQTPTLVISSASTADAATTANGYYVIVSNRCGGSVFSTTNALVLDHAANLVWAGDGVSNLWDVATSTNWNTDTAVFNFGDNVTFDDTSANTAVTLNSTNLSPSLITVNGTQNFTFSGNGTLAGGGGIVVNTTGTLTVSVANNETGGIVASNGTYSFSTLPALGPGGITLAGGALAAPNIGLVNVTNTITVVGSNSVIGVNSTGGQPLVLSGTFNFNGGSLVFQNNTTKQATPAIQLTGGGFTCNLPVTLNAGTVSGGLLVSGNNTSGTQVWNGLIGGTGGMERNGAGGTTLLNNTNLYSGITELFSGALGVGADSVSILSPPTVDAGPLGVGTFTIGTQIGTTNELFAVGGPRVEGNAINFATTNGGPPFVIGGSNNLTLSGTMDLNSSNRVIETDNTGLTVLSGVISDSGQGNGLINGLTKTGSGVLYLDGANTYPGDTTNSAGTLAGSGSLTGRLIVQSGATLGAGGAGAVPGTFTVGSDLILGGNGWFKLNKAQAQSNDLVMVSGILTNIGTGVITVTNANPGAALVVGDSFTLFSQAVSNGAALTVTGGGMNWTNNLAVDGSIQALSVATTVIIPTLPPAITNFSLVGGNVVISGTNGQAGGTYYLLMTTNLTNPRNQWQTVATNVLGANNYTFTGTNAVRSSSAQQFYMLSSTNYNP